MSIDRRLARLEADALPPPVGRVSAEVAAVRARLADRAAWFHAAPPAVRDYLGGIIASCGPWGNESADEVRTIVSARTKETHPLFWRLTDIVEFAYGWRGGIGLEDVQVRLLDRARYRLEGHIVQTECNHFIGPESRERTHVRLFGADHEQARLEAPPGCIPHALLDLWRERGTRDPDVLALAGLGAAELALLAEDEA